MGNSIQRRIHPASHVKGERPWPQNNPTCPRPDIREARIDPTRPWNERLRLFASSVSDPHRFRVGDTAVGVLFDDGAPSLQSCLTNLCKRLQ